MKVVLIGSGNVASWLGPELKKKGHKIIQLYSRSRKNSNLLAGKLKCRHVNSIKEITSEGDVYIVAIRDEILDSFLSKLTFMPKLIVHTSGTVDIKVFPKNFKNTGVLYPLQAFSKKSKRPPEMVPFCIEGSNSQSAKKIKSLAKTLSKNVYDFDSKKRAMIHLSAVFVNNFSNHMFTLGNKILSRKNLPFEILRPLILETALKVQTGLPVDMQSGPARRGDQKVMRKHLQLLREFPGIKKIYSQLSKSIEKEYRR